MRQHTFANPFRNDFAHFCKHHTRGDGIDGDAPPSQLTAKDSGHGSDAGLGLLWRIALGVGIAVLVGWLATRLLGDGTLTLSITLTDTLGNAGSAATATVIKDTLAPTIVSVTPPAAGTYDDL